MKINQDKIKHSIAMSTCGVLVTTGLTLTLSLCLASCDRQEQIDRSTAGGKAIYMARAIKHEIHAEYLNNYALDATSKAKGLEALAQKYIDQKWQQNAEYIQEFGYECEKLGFKEFLQEQKLPCEKLNEAQSLILISRLMWSNASQKVSTTCSLIMTKNNGA